MKYNSQNKTQNQTHSPRPFSRRDFLSKSIKVGAAALTSSLIPTHITNAAGKYNVLFMIVDDLRPMLGCYGIPQMHTPNIDSLAHRGTLFNRAYCQYPLCNPSRASILTGLRPDSTMVKNNTADYRDTVPDAVDMYEHFKTNGYSTYSVGKVRHHPAPFMHGPSWKALNVNDDELSDGQTAAETERLLTEIKDQRFFLTVGFDKPHLAFHAPKTYYDLYDLDTFGLPATPDYPQNAPLSSYNKIDLFRIYQDIPSGDEPISDEKTIELIRAYAACTSFMDAQVGRVIQHLDRLGLSKNTVIVFCGDHGFHLGEHGTWRKNTLFEVGVRSPLIISVPNKPSCQTNTLVELVDIFPTLCDACELPIPSELEGISLIPTIEEPEQPVKSAAFSYLKRAGNSAVSMRTDRYRYTEWGHQARLGRELYDYQNDPHEKVNIADHPDYTAIVKDLSQRLRAGWKEAKSTSEERIPIPNSLPWDINDDGIVDIQDLLIVSNSVGESVIENPKVDVNKDGIVDLIDLLYVAAHLGESCFPSAPVVDLSLSHRQINDVSEWLTSAYQLDDGSDVFRDGIAQLEALVQNLLPRKTKLLPNYPNPFNPETWIPYDLAHDAHVQIDIYSLRGEVIRSLKIGFKPSGTYRNKELAAYWDGRNSVGEFVQSGIYYYCLTADQSKAIRKMVLRK